MPLPSSLIAAALAAGLAAPAVAAAAPPPNDNYLSSTTIDPPSAAFPRDVPQRGRHHRGHDAGRHVQPQQDGVPFAGGDPEPTACAPGGPAFGKTAWWDFRPPFPGGAGGGIRSLWLT